MRLYNIIFERDCLVDCLVEGKGPVTWDQYVTAVDFDTARNYANALVNEGKELNPKVKSIGFILEIHKQL